MDYLFEGNNKKEYYARILRYVHSRVNWLIFRLIFLLLDISREEVNWPPAVQREAFCDALSALGRGYATDSAVGAYDVPPDSLVRWGPRVGPGQVSK